MFWQAAGTSFGIAAALIVAGGWVFLQYKRDQMHFKLLAQALDHGLQALPGSVPAWVRSLRQGILILLLGIGVLAAGVVFHIQAANIDEIPVGMQTPGPESNPAARAQLPAPPPPAMHRWERVQQLKLIGLINSCAGGVLILLGVARMAFARIERRYITPRATAAN